MAERDVTYRAPRTVSLVSPRDDPRFGKDDLSLADFESDRRYVLLGEPGMGKSEAFKAEARSVDACEPVSARRFMRGGSGEPSDCPGTPVFIDGLDEARAGGADPRAPLDRILERLCNLGYPPFRLSCRAGSWLDPGDTRELATSTSGGESSGAERPRVLALNPLSHEDVQRIVSPRIENAEGFVAEAFDHGLEAFLWNPQLLKVLLDAVEATGWPSSPREAFEVACRELARERNPEHQDARRGTVQPSRDAVLHAAGRLSALLLLTGGEGWTATDSNDPDVLSLLDVEAEDDAGTDGGRAALLAALDSSLFAGTSAVRVPAHRLFAEFLGAAYLDRRIRALGGPGVRRVLSLLLGYDGVPPPDLRGLCAWLAALNREARSTLIHADPIGVAFDGDASGFTMDERRELFAQLETSPRLPLVWPSSAALGALAGGGKRNPLWDLTSSPNRADTRQMLVARLLAGLTRTTRTATADRDPGRDADDDLDCRSLLRVVYDITWRIDVRCNAIEALDRILAPPPRPSAELQKILSDIEAGHLSDEDHELRGTLLTRMYPGDIPPTEIWDHFVVRPRGGATGYALFWDRLADESDPEDVWTLLDGLCQRAREVVPALADDGFGSIVLALVARGLELFGDEATASDLYRWLGLVEAAPNRTGLVPAHSAEVGSVDFFPELSGQIRSWLRSRQTLQHELIELALGEQEDKVGRQALDQSIGRKLVGEEAPAGFRQWCLERARKLADTRPKIAEELAWWTVRLRDGWGPPLPDDQVARAVRNTPRLRRWNDERLEAKSRREREEAEWKERNAVVMRRVRERQKDYVAAVREQAAKLRDGRCHAALLHELAQIYFDELDDDQADADPVACLRQRLDGDDALVSAALAGFRKLLSRDDLPDLAATASLHGSGEFSFFALPFLAGLAEEERANRDPLELLDETGLRRAVGYHLVSGQHVSLFARRTVRDSAEARDEPGLRSVIEAYLASGPRGPGPQTAAGSDGRREDVRGPGWYRLALQSRPAPVADAIVAIHRAQVRKKAGPDRHIRDLSRDPAYARVAPLAAPRMFSVFPSRCTEPQVETLRVLLWTALDSRNMSPAELTDVVRKRSRRQDMDVAQRIQWLCAGLFVAREEYLPQLVDYVAAGRDVRVHHVVDFFVAPGNRFRGSLAFEDWKANELADLLRALAGRLPRYQPLDGVGFLSDRQVARLRAEPLLNRLIGALAERADDEAAVALDSLAADPALHGWAGELSRARETQAERLRAAKHRTPTLGSLQEALRGGPPASAADLLALGLDKLDELGAHIRDADTNDWLQYWHRDPESRRPIKPQDETDCRDALISDLRRLLQPQGVDAQKEGHYADDTRADIRLAFGPNIAIPVEIKRNSHREVWRAAEQQLAAKYTRAPESEGYGIYLVLWFGPEREHMKVLPPTGTLPRTASDLRDRLEEQLPPALRPKIHIVVIDVSPSRKYASAKS